MASNTIANINQEVTLGLNLANAVIPMITGIINDIKSKANPDGTMEYTVVLTTGQDNLTKAAANFQASLDDINEQLSEDQTTNAKTVADAIHNPTPSTTGS